jgi:hypothetical protein
VHIRVRDEAMARQAHYPHRSHEMANALNLKRERP